MDMIKTNTMDMIRMVMMTIRSTDRILTTRTVSTTARAAGSKPAIAKKGKGPSRVLFFLTLATAGGPLLYQAESYRKQRRPDENADEAEGEHSPHHTEQNQDKRQIAAAAD